MGCLIFVKTLIKRVWIKSKNENIFLVRNGNSSKWMTAEEWSRNQRQNYLTVREGAYFYESTNRKQSIHRY